jgi:hypothetical protein
MTRRQLDKAILRSDLAARRNFRKIRNSFRETVEEPFGNAFLFLSDA